MKLLHWKKFLCTTTPCLAALGLGWLCGDMNHRPKPPDPSVNPSRSVTKPSPGENFDGFHLKATPKRHQNITLGPSPLENPAVQPAQNFLDRKSLSTKTFSRTNVPKTEKTASKPRTVQDLLLERDWNPMKISELRQHFFQAQKETDWSTALLLVSECPSEEVIAWIDLYSQTDAPEQRRALALQILSKRQEPEALHLLSQQAESGDSDRRSWALRALHARAKWDANTRDLLARNDWKSEDQQ
ncbi:MAG: hypothetical protein QF752_04630 [Planctomycetota bacterium]|jgi:hypothetical protein|nr:hypothetical protein [Planctomycetota bacterium]